MPVETRWVYEEPKCPVSKGGAHTWVLAIEHTSLSWHDLFKCTLCSTWYLVKHPKGLGDVEKRWLPPVSAEEYLRAAGLMD